MQIRRRAADVLPSYAVPARVCVIDALPLTSNGTIDRGALAARAAQDRPTLNTAHREPESPIERAVVQVWVDHLGILDIGADDDFFELGGHSLLAVTIIAELYEAYGVEISPLSFYLGPNPAGLARTLQKIGVAP
jgi:acyl carrier protein